MLREQARETQLKQFTPFITNTWGRKKGTHFWLTEFTILFSHFAIQMKFFCPTTPLQNYSLFDRKREWVFLVTLLENTQSHSTTLSWWTRTSHRKLVERGAPLSLSVWPSHSWPSGHHHGTSRRSHHWGPRHHGHVPAHRWPHSRSCKTKQRKGEKKVRKYFSWESLTGFQLKIKM